MGPRRSCRRWNSGAAPASARRRTRGPSGTASGRARFDDRRGGDRADGTDGGEPPARLAAGVRGADRLLQRVDLLLRDFDLRSQAGERRLGNGGHAGLGEALLYQRHELGGAAIALRRDVANSARCALSAFTSMVRLFTRSARVRCSARRPPGLPRSGKTGTHEHRTERRACMLRCSCVPGSAFGRPGTTSGKVVRDAPTSRHFRDRFSSPACQ